MSPRMLPDGIRKIPARISMSEEMLYNSLSWSDVRFQRKHTTTETPAAPEEWKLYRRALKALKVLQAYDGTDWGGPDYGTEVNPPNPKVTFEYLETIDEWLERCRALS